MVRKLILCLLPAMFVLTSAGCPDTKSSDKVKYNTSTEVDKTGKKKQQKGKD